MVKTDMKADGSGVSGGGVGADVARGAVGTVPRRVMRRPLVGRAASVHALHTVRAGHAGHAVVRVGAGGVGRLGLAAHHLQHRWAAGADEPDDQGGGQDLPLDSR